MRRLLIIGDNTTAQRIVDFVNYYKLYDIIGLAVNKQYKTKDYAYNYRVFNLEDIEKCFNKEKDLLFVAIAWNKLNRDRRDVYLRYKNLGYNFANLISSKAIVRGCIQGENCWIGDNVIIESGAKILDNIFLDHNSFVGTNSKISNHCYLGAGSLVAGNCEIGEQSFIGLNSTVFDGIKVGRLSIVGATTTVKTDLPDFSLIRNSSANFIVKQYLPDEIENKLIA